MNNTNVEQNKEFSPYRLFMVFFNLVAIIVAGLSFEFFGFPPEFHSLMRKLDLVLSVILLGDFAWRFSQIEASSRKQFLLPWGLIDFLGSLPVGPYFRFFRLIRIFRLIQLLRKVGWKALVVNLKRQMAESSLWGVVALTIPTILVSGWWIYRMEDEFCSVENTAANICSLGDGIWWSFVTVTTVGYGDHFPVSNGGRILAGVLMTIGVGLFGILTSYLATVFIRQDDEQVETELVSELADVKRELAEIKALLKDSKAQSL